MSETQKSRTRGSSPFCLFVASFQHVLKRQTSFVVIANIPEKIKQEKSQNGIFYSAKWEKWIALPSIGKSKKPLKLTTFEKFSFCVL